MKEKIATICILLFATIVRGQTFPHVHLDPEYEYVPYIVDLKRYVISDSDYMLKFPSTVKYVYLSVETSDTVQNSHCVWFFKNIDKFKNLQALEFASGKYDLTRIDFKKLKKLKYLIITRATVHLHRLSSPSIELLVILTGDVDLNNIAWIEFSSLKYAMLRSFEYAFPDSFFYCKTLSHCNLSGCNIKKIPEAIRYIKNINYINLHNNYLLYIIPEGIGNLKSLHMLDITNTSIKSLPNSIFEIPKLFLKISGCSAISSEFSCDTIEYIKSKKPDNWTIAVF